MAKNSLVLVSTRSWTYDLAYSWIFSLILCSETKNRCICFEGRVNNSIIMSVSSRARASNSLSFLIVIISNTCANLAAWNVAEGTKVLICTWTWYYLIPRVQIRFQTEYV